MTAGVINTGVFNSSIDKFHYSKSWNGEDGRYIPDSVGPQDKWNSYVMVSSRFHGSNPNRLGYTYYGTPGEVDNHAWFHGGGDDGTSGYAPYSGGGSHFPAIFPLSLFNLFWTPREDFALLSKLLKKVKGHQLNLGVSLAEVDKLAGTILGTLKSLVFSVEDLSKGNFARFARRFGASPPTRDVVRRLRLRDISGRFLEMRYAWAPAIADAYEAATAFEALSNGPRKSIFRKTIRKGFLRKWNTNYCIGLPQEITVTKTHIFEMYEEMGAFRQMGLTNPATVLWERLPWSFVIDWFIPIGTYLDLIGQVPFMNGRWCTTRSIRYNTSGTFQMREDIPGLKSKPPYVDGEWEIFSMERSTTANPGVPFPNFSVFGAIQGKRVGNAIALAQQVFAKAHDRGAFTEPSGPDD